MNFKVVSRSVYVGKSLIQIDNRNPTSITRESFNILVKGIDTVFKMNKIRFISRLYSLLFLSCLCFLLCSTRVMVFFTYPRFSRLLLNVKKNLMRLMTREQ